LIDVREAYEYEADNLGGIPIPLGELEQRLTEISFSKKTIVHCQSGQRSAKAVQLLRRHGHENVYNLSGGINAWRAAEKTSS
jgi:adenylyltransferase/sulfurtransferase